MADTISPEPDPPPASSSELAESLHEGLGQTLIGISMLARSHARALRDRRDPEAVRARQLFRYSTRAVREVGRLIRTLDHGRLR